MCSSVGGASAIVSLFFFASLERVLGVPRESFPASARALPTYDCHTLGIFRWSLGTLTPLEQTLIYDAHTTISGLSCSCFFFLSACCVVIRATIDGEQKTSCAPWI